jgi:arylsulfatase A-like enzyme
MYNVLLITIDSLRPDFLGCYGHSEKLSPNIDRLAKEGVLFKSVITQGPRTLLINLRKFQKRDC